MNSSAAAEDSNERVCSHGSLANPHGQKDKRTCSSEPFIKPKLSFMKLPGRILQKILTHLNVTEPQNDPEQTNFSMEDSKSVIKTLASELDRVFQLKDVTIVSGVTNEKIDDEECQAVVLEWAELKSVQQNSSPEESLMKQETMQISPESKTGEQTSQKSDRQQRLKEANRILTEWTNQLNNLSKGSVHVSGEHKAVLQGLCKQWKKEQLANSLLIMDFIIRNTLQDNKSQELLLKEWYISEQKLSKPGGLPIPTSVWKWITNPSDEVTLDPNTANPTLMLSEDGCRLRTKTHHESNPWDILQRKCLQYDGWTCVQAKEGYSTGRHYWEVDVKGKCDWRLGVVKESAPRRGFVKMTTTAGYWTLRLQLGSLMALTDPVTKLNQANPSTIGVYLDLDKGYVSFFDTVKKRHIYTFKADFNKSEKIYPVFGTVESDKSLRILQVQN